MFHRRFGQTGESTLVMKVVGPVIVQRTLLPPSPTGSAIARLYVGAHVAYGPEPRRAIEAPASSVLTTK
jgi:hypothetical protein